MKSAIVLAVGLAFQFASTPLVLSAEPRCWGEAKGTAEPEVDGRPRPRPLHEIQGMMKERKALVDSGTKNRPGKEVAYEYCIVAELMKRVGDPEAEEYYRKAISADPENAEYRWILGDYFRNFRGPQQPLFPKAEERYDEAAEKTPVDQRHCRNRELFCYIHRSLIALYERDGVPFVPPSEGITKTKPHVFFSTRNTFGRLLTDVGEIDEVRDFTSETLFASSRERLNRDLSEDELRSIIRPKQQFDTFNRFRVRYKALPVLDLFYQHRTVQDAQITNFFVPNQFNDVHVNLIGGALEAPVDLYPAFDLLLRGEVRGAKREGLIEFLQDASEDVTTLVGKAVLSRFVGPDKGNLEVTVAFDRINQNVANPIKRRVLIVAPTFRYQLFRPLPLLGAPFERSLAPQSSEFFAGAAWNRETFGSVDVWKQDFFVGLSARHMRGIGKGQSFDITVQPTLFTSERDGKDAQGQTAEPLGNQQYRTAVTLLYRIYDKENVPYVIPPVAFVNLVFLGSHDLALKGPKDFENFKVGGQLDAKFIIAALQGGTTVLASARYELQRFFRLDRDVHLFLLNVSLGF